MNARRCLRPAALLLLAALLAACAAGAPRPQGPQGFAFALIGDAPYSESEDVQFEAMIERLNGRELAFVLHVGDIKGGGSPCTDAALLAARRQLQASRHPLVLVPGDNEWTDCHRRGAGGFDPLERLAKLRELFFAGRTGLGRAPIALERQADLDARHREHMENVRWIHRGVLFVGLNIPGSNNNLGRNAAMDAEHHRRMRANLDWLADAFRLARELRLPGVAIAIQANPSFAGEMRLAPGQADGFATFREALAGHVRAYGRPVLLVHGDTHRFQANRPLRDPRTGEPIDNLLRVETWGSPVVRETYILVEPDTARVFRLAD